MINGYYVAFAPNTVWKVAVYAGVLVVGADYNPQLGGLELYQLVTKDYSIVSRTVYVAVVSNGSHFPDGYEWDYVKSFTLNGITYHILMSNG